MIRNVILQQHAEKENLLSRDYVARENLVPAGKLLENDLIKIITGPRRAGKSVFSFLLLKDKQFAYVNFDDENLIKIENYDEIVEAVFEVYPHCDFIFFDEIQNLKNWELFVNKLQRRGHNLILTGSNANLLSKEMSTVLTGRFSALEVFPFSFTEFMQARNFPINRKDMGLPEVKGKVLSCLDEYMGKGGFPEVVVKNLDAKSYLETLFDAVLFKDVVKRYKVRFSQKIYDLALYMVSNTCSEFTFTRLRNSLEFRSTNTVQKYLNALEESYLFFSLNRFSFKNKEQIKTPKKTYLIDNGFALAKSFQFSLNSGKLMENLIFLALLRKGYKANKSVFYYKTRNGKEVDFVVKEGLKISRLIQSCFNVEKEEVKTREIKALHEAGEELDCAELFVVTWDKDRTERFKGREIKFVPLWKWLAE